MTIKLTHPLLTEKYTQVHHEKDFKFNAPCHFEVLTVDGNNTVVTEVHFQEGPIKECGVNGCMNEDLIHMVVARLEGFQNSPYQCDENAEALEHLLNALKALRIRTDKREVRGVEGTHTI